MDELGLKTKDTITLSHAIIGLINAKDLKKILSKRKHTKSKNLFTEFPFAINKNILNHIVIFNKRKSCGFDLNFIYEAENLIMDKLGFIRDYYMPKNKQVLIISFESGFSGETNAVVVAPRIDSKNDLKNGFIFLTSEKLKKVLK